MRDCICADPENCTERVPGYRCRKDDARVVDIPAEWRTVMLDLVCQMERRAEQDGEGSFDTSRAMALLKAASASNGREQGAEEAVRRDMREALLKLADATRDTLRSHPETNCCAVTHEALDEAYDALGIPVAPAAFAVLHTGHAPVVPLPSKAIDEVGTFTREDWDRLGKTVVPRFTLADAASSFGDAIWREFEDTREHRLAMRAVRLLRLTQLNAPEDIIKRERELLRKSFTEFELDDAPKMDIPWIACEDRKPANGERVYVFGGDTTAPLIQYNYGLDTWTVYEDFGCWVQGGKWTHWKPLGPPPASAPKEPVP